MTRNLRVAYAAAAISALALPGLASAHVERPAYWPDPAPDQAIAPEAGGEVPKARSLASSLRRAAPGATRVVCQPDSLDLLRSSIRKARTEGYDIRPSDRRTLSRRLARRYLQINEELYERCRFDEVQAAVTASGNNDRVVVMPGVYTEPSSRAKPTDDPDCERFEVDGDPPSRKGAASYAYQFNCPNDQNLIAVMGRELGSGEDPAPPRWNRHGIPNLGACIRCNLQIEGSSFDPEDVVVEAGDPAAGNGGPSGTGTEKDVAIRADRADGFVLRNVTTRHAREHGIYVIETDGYLLDRFKAFYNGLYGTLTFVDDHGVQSNCEAAGHGDSGLYPGAPVETGEQRPEGTEFRFNQEIRNCDSHHNLAGYSATNGNAVWVHHNNFYDNALGFNTDVATSPGHPGFPGDSTLVEENNFYSNNYNLYAPEPAETDVTPAFPYPVGTGLWIAGGNSHTVRNNRFWDNWRRGVMIFAVPDVLVCGPVAENEQAGCDPSRTSTSHRNRVYGNVMGIAPNGEVKPNGADFWWDSFVGNRGNCWFDNRGANAITSSPASLPNCNGGKDPDTSIGTGSVQNEAELGVCAVSFFTGSFDPDSAPCPWFDSPPPPSAPGAREREAEQRARAVEAWREFCAERGSSPTCDRSGTVRAGRR